MKTLLTTLALVASTAAHAEFWNGNDLYNKMLGDSQDRLLAIGYVIGVADAAQNRDVCIPQRVAVRQVYEIVEDALRTSSDMRHQYSADIFAVLAIKRVFPCEQQRGSRL